MTLPMGDTITLTAGSADTVIGKSLSLLTSDVCSTLAHLEKSLFPHAPRCVCVDWDRHILQYQDTRLSNMSALFVEQANSLLARIKLQSMMTGLH